VEKEGGCLSVCLSVCLLFLSAVSVCCFCLLLTFACCCSCGCSLFGPWQNGHVGVVALLLKRNANVNAPNHQGHTALHMAIEYGCWDVVLCLEAHGADGDAWGRGGGVGGGGVGLQGRLFYLQPCVYAGTASAAAPRFMFSLVS
jgi:hypothetical protein